MYGQPRPPEWKVYARKYKDGLGDLVAVAYEQHEASVALAEAKRKYKHGAWGYTPDHNRMA